MSELRKKSFNFDIQVLPGGSEIIAKVDEGDGSYVNLSDANAEIERLSRELEASRALIRWLDEHSGQDNIVTIDAPEHADAYAAARGGLGGDGETKE